ncbi:hypothetical protein RugamoR57_45820 [Duganella caerulea]|uniref:polysaccharide deacetylase family protein n=1 Tax=Duganella caerulea TaxID=2885762 RepID=UPI0030E767DD
MIKQMIFHALRFCGASFAWLQLRQRGRVTILCFHDPSPEDFRRHVRRLKKWYRIIALDTYLAARQAGDMSTLPHPALVLTIDDGHRGNAELQAVLAQEGVPVTIFLSTAGTDTDKPFWWTLPQSKAEVERLKRLPNHERLAELQRIPAPGGATRQALTRDEIRALASYADFQSHTVSHPILPQCDAEEARAEIFESKAEIERRYGWKVTTFAYPNGDYSQRDIELVREAGYFCAVTVDEGLNDGQTDLFRLKRILVDDDAGVSELLVKASGLMPAMKNAIKKWRGRPTDQFHAAPNRTSHFPAQ